MKKHLLPIALVMMVVMLAGCSNWVAPKRVNISTDATFKVPIGDISASDLFAGEGEGGEGEGGSAFDMLDMFTPEGLANIIDPDGTKNVGVYEYTGDKIDGKDDGLTYLMHKSIASLDPASLLGSFSGSPTDMLSDVDTSGSTFDFPIDVPEMKESKKITVLDLGDIKNRFLTQIKQDIIGASFDVNIPESGSSTPLGLDSQFDSNVINIEAEVDGKIYYSEGSYVQVTVNKINTWKNTSPDYSLKLHAYLADFDTKAVLGECDSGYVEVANGGTLRIPFKGELPGKMKVVVNGVTTGGTLSFDNIHEYRVTLSISDSFGIDKVTGINATPNDLGFTITPISETIDFDTLAVPFSHLKIAEGSVVIKSAAPEGWEGINCTATVTFNGMGNSITEIPDAENLTGYFLNKEKDFAGVQFTRTDEDHKLTFSGSLDFTINDATIDFTKSSSSKIEAEISFEIKEFEEAKILAAKFLNEEGSTGEKTILKTEVPSVFGDMIKKIEFNEKIHTEGGTEKREGKGYGFTYTVNNTLPEGNDIPLRFVSQFLEYDSNDCLDEGGAIKETFPVNKEGKPTDVVLTKFDTISFTKPADGEQQYIEFKLVLPEELTLHNIKASTKYNIGLSNVQPVLDWDKIVLDFSKPLASGDYDLSAFDIKDLISQFGFEDIALPEVEAYVFIRKTDGDFLKNAKIQGKLELNYKDSEGADKKKTIFNSNEGSAGNISSESDFSWPESGKPFTINLDDVNHFAKINLTELLNTDAKDLSLTYDVSIVDSGSEGEYTLYASSFDEIGNQNLTADIAVKIPFKLTLTEPFEFPIMDLLNPDYADDPTMDLLNRGVSEGDPEGGSEEPDPYSSGNNNGDGDNQELPINIADMAESVDYIQLKINLTNKLLNIKSTDNSPLIKFTMKDDSINFNKEIEIKGDGLSTISIKGEEVKKIIESKVFHPELKLFIGSAGSSIAINDAFLKATDEEKAEMLKLNLMLELKFDGSKPLSFDLASNDLGGM